MSAGRYLAAERAAFDIDAAPTIATTADDPLTQAAIAPLAETAVQHMTAERMIAFIRWMETLN